jgi:hypothetical protein
MWMSRQWVAQENDGRNCPFSDHRTDLQIATEWPGETAVDGQPELIFQQSSSCARRYNLKTGQHRQVLSRKMDHLVLATIVGDQRNPVRLPRMHYGCVFS